MCGTGTSGRFVGRSGIRSYNRLSFKAPVRPVRAMRRVHVGGCMFKNTGGSRNTRGTDTRISEDKQPLKQPQNRDHTMRLTVRCSNHCYALRVTAAVSTGDYVWAPGVGSDRARALVSRSWVGSWVHTVRRSMCEPARRRRRVARQWQELRPAGE
jgi:hypothetical protein